ncbi:hypothetical protein OAG24_00250 [bacterium]|nr:hypothetical protein [bacterium]
MAGITDDCSICLQELNLPVKLDCGHKFCFMCLKQNIESPRSNSNQCPLCRDTFDENILDTFETNDNVENKNTRWMYSGRSDGWWYFSDQLCNEIEEKYQKFINLEEPEEEEEEYCISIPLGSLNSSKFKDLREAIIEGSEEQYLDVFKSLIDQRLRFEFKSITSEGDLRYVSPFSTPSGTNLQSRIGLQSDSDSDSSPDTQSEEDVEVENEADSNDSFECEILDKKYLINFRTMTQTQISNGFTRIIKRGTEDEEELIIKGISGVKFTSV